MDMLTSAQSYETHRDAIERLNQVGAAKRKVLFSSLSDVNNQMGSAFGPAMEKQPSRLSCVGLHFGRTDVGAAIEQYLCRSKALMRLVFFQSSRPGANCQHDISSRLGVVGDVEWKKQVNDLYREKTRKGSPPKASSSLLRGSLLMLKRKDLSITFCSVGFPTRFCLSSSPVGRLHCKRCVAKP